jgi:cytochrome P450
VESALTRSLPKGPQLPAITQTMLWVFRPSEFLLSCQRRFGDLFTLRLGLSSDSPPNVVIAHPELAAAVMSERDKVRVGTGRRSIEPIFGSNSILLADGDAHLRMRRLLAAPLNGRRVDRQRAAIVAATDRELDGWPLNRSFGIRRSMEAIALRTILDTVFGIHDPDHRQKIGEPIHQLLTALAHPFSSLAMALPSRLGPIEPGQAVGRPQRRVDEALYAEIALRREGRSTGSGDDTLTWLMNSSERGEEALSDAELRDHLVTLLLAGHETTATALAWTFEHLLHAPRAMARAREEAATATPGGAYLDATIMESLRLNPPLPIVHRTVVEPLRVGGHLLPAGTVAVPCAHLIHRNPVLYPRPLEFRPERFMGKSPPGHGWLPFGGGARRCLGAGFAQRQMRVILQRVLERAELQPAAARPASIRRRAIVLAPSRGSQVVLRSRVPQGR